jgi:5-formyltetrahydrofolate cyclo-ligase
MSREDWQTSSMQLCQQLAALPLFIQAQTVLAYFSVRQEPDLSSLFQIDKTWGFSRCIDRSLVWHQWSSHSPYPLQKGAFGILEPHPDAPTLHASEIDLILVPAIACDRRGYRLGYGGGFYDRLLSSPNWLTIPTIGIVFEFALLPLLPHDDWDRSLTAVCTEWGYWDCPPVQ